MFFLIIILLSINSIPATQTYLNESGQWENNLTRISLSAIAFGDIDNDGDLDLALSGTATWNTIVKIYLNNGTTLTESQQWQQNLTGVNYGSLAFGDIDNDGDLDLALSGCSSGADFVDACDSGAIRTFIYLNNGTSLVESSQWGNNLTLVYRTGALTFGDIDNDGDLDLSLTGQTASTIVIKIYLNNGTSLVESSQWGNNLTAIRKSSQAFGDIDNDGDLDLIISGRDGSDNKLTKAYLNNGTTLTESQQWQSNLINVEDSSLSFGDIDNDGDLDLSLTGCCDKHRIYRNNGSSFIETNGEVAGGLAGVFAGSQAFGDYDNDGDLDLIANGRETSTTLYLYNVSAENFTRAIQDPESHIFNIIYGSLAWLDLDNDTDLDLIETGYGNAGLRAFIYISNASLTRNNTKPSPPNSSFSANYVNNILTLSWGNGSDVETNTSGLYYNLMVGNSTKNNTIVSGAYGGSSNPTAGYFGNMMQRKSVALNVQLEANKTYYWYVQTIDTGLAKSNWSSLQTFNTSLDVTKPNVTIQEPSPNASLHTFNSYFIFNATVTDANLTNVTLYANWTGSMIANETNSSGINGTYTFNRNLTGYNDGMYSWYIYACDSVSNCQSSELRNFYLDRAYPKIYLLSPSNASTQTSSSIVTFTYNVTDIDIANCSLIIDNSIVNTSSSVSESINQSFNKSLSNAAYTWQVNCTDYVGYTNSSSIYSLTVSYTAPSSTSSGGGGGGGGTSITTKNYTATNEQIIQGYTQQLANNDKIEFKIENKNHSLTINNINVSLNYANLTLNSTTINFIIYVNETRKFELTNDSYYDLLVKLNNITENKANLTIKQIYEEIEEKEAEESEKKAKEEVEKRKEEIKKKKLLFWIIIVLLIISLIISAIIKFLRRYIKYKKWRKYSLIG